MDLSNCLSLLSLAEAYGSASLLQSAQDFVIENFYDLSQRQDFLEMQVRLKCVNFFPFLSKMFFLFFVFFYHVAVLCVCLN